MSKRILGSANRIIIFHSILESVKVWLWHSRSTEKKEEEGCRGRAIKMRPGTKGTRPPEISTPARSTFVDISQPVIAFRPERTRITGGRNGPHTHTWNILSIAYTRGEIEKKERKREKMRRETRDVRKWRADNSVKKCISKGNSNSW